MHRCGSGFLLSLAITFVVALTGCLGKSSSNPSNDAIASVTLSPTGMISMDVGTTQVFSATAKNASGGTVLGVDIQFIVDSGSPNSSAPLSIASNGNGCAGTWDASDAICSPGTPGIALVTAVTNGIRSPQTTIFVHQHVDSIQIVQAQSPPPQYDCFSQGQIWHFEGIAYSNKVDITTSVGPMSWSFSNGGVVTLTPYSPPQQPNVLNQIQTTAKSPGITQVFATVSGTTSTPYSFTTCLVQSVSLQIGGEGAAGRTITINNGGSVPVVASVFDTLHLIANSPALTDPPLTWSTTDPEVAAFSSTTSNSTSNSATARANLGGATLTASCTPPSCNIGVLPGLPIYSSDGLLPNGTQAFGTISVDVTSTSKVPTYTAWAATTDCSNEPGCSSAMFSVTPGITPIGPILSLPRTPNSMMFNHVSADRVYLGSNQGLMYVDVSSASPSATLVSGSSTPCNVALCGKVLAISNDGKQVVVSDTVSTPSQVYIFNGGGSTAPIDLIIPGDTATAAAFSPDQSKIFILTNTGKMYIYSTVDAFTSVPIATSVTDVKFSADGSFAYVAGAPGAASISGFATCNAQPTTLDPLVPPPLTFPFVTTSGIPLQIFPSPDAQHVFALDPSEGGIDNFSTVDEQISLLYNQFTCNAPTVNFPQLAQSFDLGQGKNFVPVYAQLVADGSEMIIVARNVPAVLLFNVSDGTTKSVQLIRQGFVTTDPLSADASTDGSQVYIAACDQYVPNTKPPVCGSGSVHIVNTCGVLSCNIPPDIGQGDFQQVPYTNINDNGDTNMCNGQGTNAPLCLPNLIAIKPQ